MKRRKIIIFAFLTVLLMVFISQSWTIAQGLETREEDSEPTALAPDNLTALVSSSFTYQGQLKNGGAAVNAHCDFIWNLFADSSGGTSLAMDTDTNVQLTNGLFTAVVNVPASVIDGNGRYVEIQVRCPTGTGAYTTLSPRQELQAAPYALGLRLPFSHSINSSVAPVFAITNTGGTGSSPSILGSSFGGDGVHGLSTGAASADNGVYGETNSTTANEAGVKGISTTVAMGGHFTSSTGTGAYGVTSSATNFGGYFDNTAVTTSGGALYADGDAKQSLAGDGFVKAGIYVGQCGSAGSTIDRFFNNVNTAAITVINGAGAGRCTIDFGFNMSSRYITATAYGSGAARTVTFDFVPAVNRLDFFRFDQTGAGSNGGIMILVY